MASERTETGHHVLWLASARAVVRLTWARTFTPMLLAGIAVLVLLPMVFSLVFAARGPLAGDPVAFLVERYDQLVLTIAVPIISLLLGTSAFAALARRGSSVPEPADWQVSHERPEAAV